MTSLPPLYSGWMTEYFGEGAEPDEPRATCMSCAMLDRPGQPKLDVAFNPEHKCCTYQPNLPNFLVGRILRDSGEVGEWSRRLIRQRIRQRFAVTPVSIDKPPVYAALYELSAVHGSSFGRAKGLRCPYYVDRDGGLCGIHQHRTAICATWFCKFDRGPLGRVYARAVESLFKNVEHALKYWALREIGFPAENLAEVWTSEVQADGASQRPLGPDQMNGTVSDAAYRALWGPAVGHEEEIYAACAERVAALTFADVRRVAGFSVENALTVLEVVRAKMREPLPERARPASGGLVQLRSSGEAWVRHELTTLDWLPIPERLARELERFERAPVRQVIGELAAEGVAIDETLVQRLIDWQVLAPA